MKRIWLKRIKRKLRVPFEWFGIFLALCMIVFLPRHAMLDFCDILSSVMFFFDRKGRALSLRNLRIVMGRDPSGEIPPTRRETIVLKRSYRNMARSIGHAFWTCRNARERVIEAGEMSPEAKAFLAANRPAVTVSGHIGCWEILSQLAFLEGHSMMSVAKNIGTHGMTKLLMRARRSIGQEIVPAEGAFRPLMKGIRDGKSLGLLVDQIVNSKSGGIWIRFFGRPMPVSAAPAFFAAKSKAPIVVAWSRPLKDGRYRCEMISGYAADEARDIWKMTQRCIHDLEKVIRRHPSCWVLNYRYFREKATQAELNQLAARERE